MSHPLVVDAVGEFVPLIIHNNHNKTPTPDDRALALLGEEHCTNPILRFLGADGKDLIPRKDGVYATEPILERMAAALRAAGKEPPEYLAAAAAEMNPSERRSARFAMG